MRNDAQEAHAAGIAAANAAVELFRFVRAGASYPAHALEPGTIEQLAEAMRVATAIEAQSLDLTVNRELAEMLGELRTACERFIAWGKA